MQVNIEDISATKKKIILELSPEDYRDDYNKILRSFANRAKIPGFRVGKAPLSIVERVYRDDIMEHLLDHNLIPRLREEIEKRAKPIRTPVLVKWDFDSKQGAKLIGEYEELPEFEVSDYKGLKIEIPKQTIKEEDVVKRTLEDIKNSNATAQRVEREIRPGDRVEVKIQLIDPVTRRRLPEERFAIIVSEEDDFGKRFLGRKKGERFSYEEEYPEDYPVKRIAGKKFIHEVEILDVLEIVYPEIDDDLAKKLGAENLEDLKKRLLELAKAELEHQRKEQIESAVLDALVEKNDVPAPEVLVNEAYKNLATAVLMEFASKGQRVSREKWKEISEKLKLDAEKRVKERLILLKIAEKEGIEVNREEVQEEIKKRAQSEGVSLREYRVKMEREGITEEEIKENLLVRKALNLVVENAIIKEKEEKKSADKKSK